MNRTSVDKYANKHVKNNPDSNIKQMMDLIDKMPESKEALLPGRVRPLPLAITRISFSGTAPHNWKIVSRHQTHKIK